MTHKTRFRIFLIVFLSIGIVIKAVHLYQMHQMTKRYEQILNERPR
jgi:hypothetical protein